MPLLCIHQPASPRPNLHFFSTASSSTGSPSGGLILVWENQINGNCDKWVFYYPDEANIYFHVNIYWRIIKVPVATTSLAQHASQSFSTLSQYSLHAIRHSTTHALNTKSISLNIRAFGSCSIHRISCDNKFHFMQWCLPSVKSELCSQSFRLWNNQMQFVLC